MGQFLFIDNIRCLKFNNHGGAFGLAVAACPPIPKRTRRIQCGACAFHAPQPLPCAGAGLLRGCPARMISQRCAHSFQSGLAATLRIQTLVGRNSLPLARVRRKRRALGPSNCTMRSLPPLMPPPHTLSGPYLLRMEADDLQWIEGRRRLGQLARREDGHLIPPSPCSPRLIAAPPLPPLSGVDCCALYMLFRFK